MIVVLIDLKYKYCMMTDQIKTGLFDNILFLQIDISTDKKTI